MDLINIGMAFTLAALLGYLIISNIIVRLRNRSLFVKAAQAEIDRTTVYQQAQEIFKAEYEKSASNDGFIKFMTTSRDWAFEYIESVQRDLYDLKELHDKIGTGPKTVAQANDLNERIGRVLSHLPEGEKNV